MSSSQSDDGGRNSAVKASDLKGQDHKGDLPTDKNISPMDDNVKEEASMSHLVANYNSSQSLDYKPV